MGMGIFDKIYKYMNKESKEEREDRERKEFEKERKLLFGPGSEFHSKYRNPLEKVQNQNKDLINTPPPHLMAPSINVAKIPLKLDDNEVMLRKRDDSPAPLTAREQAYSMFGSLTGTISN